MSTYSQIAWLPLCGGLTGLGLVLSWLAFRRRGFAAGLRGVAWSLLPLAAYLTGAVLMLWRIGTAIGNFASSFVFSPEKWIGVGVVGVAFVAYVVSGLLRGRQPARVSKGDAAKAAGGGGTKAVAKRPAGSSLAGPGDDDDFSEIEKILRNRGIS